MSARPHEIIGAQLFLGRDAAKIAKHYQHGLRPEIHCKQRVSFLRLARLASNLGALAHPTAEFAFNSAVLHQLASEAATEMSCPPFRNFRPGGDRLVL
jgi:hypothetical protein